MTSSHRYMPFALTILLLTSPAICTAGSFSIGGFYKSFFTSYNPPKIDNLGSLNINTSDYGIVTNRLRINAGYGIAGAAHFDVSYDFIPQVQEQNIINDLFSSASLNNNSLNYRLDDLDRRLYPAPGDSAGSFTINQNLDRLSLSLTLPHADIILGRQAIAWGTARVINPTDVIAPYTYQELDTEDRIGVDAARLRIPLGFMGEIDAGYIFGEKAEFKKSAVFLRGKYYVAKTDISALAVGFRENLMLGLDMARSVGGAGVWAEGAYVFDKALSDSLRNSAYDYFRISAGSDYSFTGKLYGFFEYHYNGAGKLNSDEYGTLATNPAYTEGAVYLLGQHYFTPGATYQLMPLITLSGEALCNLNDQSVFLSLQGEYNIAENVYLSAGAFIGLGEKPAVQYTGAFPTGVQTRSEFGSYPDIVFSSFRFYF